MSPAGCCTCVPGPSINVWHKADAQGIYCVNEFQSFLTKPASGQFSSLNSKIVTDPLEAQPKAAMLHIKSTVVMNGQSTKDF